MCSIFKTSMHLLQTTTTVVYKRDKYKQKINAENRKILVWYLMSRSGSEVSSVNGALEKQEILCVVSGNSALLRLIIFWCCLSASFLASCRDVHFRILHPAEPVPFLGFGLVCKKSARDKSFQTLRISASARSASCVCDHAVFVEGRKKFVIDHESGMHRFVGAHRGPRCHAPPSFGSVIRC